MNKYLIKYRIATVAELDKPFTFEGYEFSSYEEDWWHSDSWVASKEVEAKNAGEARYLFLKGLFPLIPELSVVSQCAFRFIANTYFIYRLTNNPEKIMYIYYVKTVPPVGLTFGDTEKENLAKLHNIPNKHGLFFIADAANAGSFYTRLSMLLIGVEGLAGEIEAKGMKRTNQTALQEILGEKFYKKLYPYGEGLRNLLFHGNVTDHQQFDGLTEEVYASIRTYLKSKYDIVLEENVVNPQRNFHDNFEQASSYEAFKEEPIFDLKVIQKSFENDRQGLFTFVPNPEEY